MANMFDYLSWRGDLSFLDSPFNPIDNIILSQLSYFTMDEIIPELKDKTGISIDLAVRIFDEKSKQPGFNFTSQFKEDPHLIRALGSSRRFGNCQLFGYENLIDTDRQLQFSAMCIYTGDGYCFIAFRGTDSSIVGWKEDFNMSFKEVIPSQIEAVKYIERMSPKIKGHLRVGGHSKGGNLAIYASSQCSKKIQKRIKKIYCNDAPGFHKKFLLSEGYAAVKNKIQSYVPQFSVIGMVLEHGYDSTIIKSSESGLMQHSLYSWEVMCNDLVRAEKTTAGSRFVNKTIREWLDKQDIAHREQFTETLYNILSAADVKSIYELEKTWFTSAGKMLKSLTHIDDETRKFVFKTIVELFRSAGRNIETFMKQE